ELLARAIHEQSPRAAHPFVAINCSAFPESLIESELFGFEKGAFTGAERPKLGKIQKAEGGTLFLDEVTELSPSAQSKILRVLQERQFEPLGSLKTVPVDIRILAATNQDLEARVREGKFRDDLFYRLFVFPIYLPSIRDRKEDLDELIDFFTDKFCREMKKESRTFSPEARKVLRDYPWPGN
ncbi:MAG: AAA domain-containing protein, partial [Nitrospinaceae bacterium]|nr:sigma-54-dependent Fis family transcriptional regulator [Nitrospinaceae bacterium]NIR56751.1 sigma-54-dependent Fis family transcriptional regulator [Nitrospinaceae bacterium]NIS86726.1 sigma-54-dependent Fis family transcriptional regulator [Nitrospinaceae bacterium]NIT84069.1 sigma-54-dependent Fis family transcriptional regulator [Nitrospinaceae bacterium]NIU46252.1 sigma-54-dependent Fis family transcriptional regulator [Nitrospinaceae bacterium]